MFEIILFLKSQNNIISIEFLIEILFGIGAEIITVLNGNYFNRFLVWDDGGDPPGNFFERVFALILNQ